jgi:hypothetical protein
MGAAVDPAVVRSECRGRPARPRLAPLAAAVLAGCVAGAARGQPAPDVVQRLERQLRQVDQEYRLSVPPDQPIAERLLLDFGGTYRFGFYSIDGPTGSSHFLRLYDLRLYMRAELDGAHRFFGRLRFLYEDWNSGDSFDGRGDELENPIGERYWYEFDLRGAVQAARGERLPYNVNLRAGKQFVEWGSGITFSDAIYAGLVDVEAFDFGLIGLIGVTPGHDTIDFDGSRPHFDTDTERAYAGAALEYRASPTHRPYAFFLVQRDRNDDDFRVFSGPLGPIPTSFDYDSYYVGLGSRGTLAANLRYRAEIVYEFGEGLSNSFDTATALAIPQTEEDIDAWAGIAGVTWLLRDRGDTRIDFEVMGGSGDKDRLDAANTFGGNRTGTKDHSFNTLGYIDTGLALAPNLSNLIVTRLGASTYPFAATGGLGRLRTGLAGLLFFKIESNAPLNVPSTDETFFGGEVDVFADWRIASDVSMNVRYGVFFPGDAACCPDDPRHFFYVGINYAF